jgi:hypothetical protein
LGSKGIEKPVGDVLYQTTGVSSRREYLIDGKSETTADPSGMTIRREKAKARQEQQQRTTADPSGMTTKRRERKCWFERPTAFS